MCLNAWNGFVVEASNGGIVRYLRVAKGEERKLLLLATCKRCECKVVLLGVARILLEETRLAIITNRYLVLGRYGYVYIICIFRYIKLIVTSLVGCNDCETVAYGYILNRVATAILHIAED